MGVMALAAPTTMEELAERAEEVATAARRTPSLDMARAMFQEVGIVRLRIVVAEAPDVIANANATKRGSEEALRKASEALEAATVAAEWELDSRFRSEANRTYLWTTCPTCEGSDLAASSGGEAAAAVAPRPGSKVNAAQLRSAPATGCPDCTGGEVRKVLTADERRDWKAREAAKTSEVELATRDLRRAEHDLAAARDDVGVAERRFSAAKAELDAAVAQLTVLATALPQRSDG